MPKREWMNEGNEDAVAGRSIMSVPCIPEIKEYLALDDISLPDDDRAMWTTG